MQKLLKSFVLTAAVTLSLSATQTQAAVISFTTNGIINSGYDATGIFGVINGNLAGKSYTQTISADDSLFSSFSSSYWYNTAGGGAIKDSVTIDGNTFSATLYNAGQFGKGNSATLGGGYDGLWASASGDLREGGRLYFQNVITAFSPFVPSLDLLQEISYSISELFIFGGENSSRFSYAGSTTFNTYFEGTPTDGQWQVSSLKGTEVPEPGPLGLMAMGLFMLFGAMKQGRRKQA